MKKQYLLHIFILFGCLHLFAQDNSNSNPAENSLGLGFQFATISEGYDYGISLTGNSDFGEGTGLGYIAQITYLQPSELISSFIDYGYEFDLSLKYDIEVTQGLEVGPTAGVGYLGVEGDGGSSTDFYFSIGATLSYFISDSIVLGFDLTNPFLDGANLVMGTSIRFQI